jgi:hypothetical protein
LKPRKVDSNARQSGRKQMTNHRKTNFQPQANRKPLSEDEGLLLYRGTRRPTDATDEYIYFLAMSSVVRGFNPTFIKKVIHAALYIVSSTIGNTSWNCCIEGREVPSIAFIAGVATSAPINIHTNVWKMLRTSVSQFIFFIVTGLKHKCLTSTIQTSVRDYLGILSM